MAKTLANVMVGLAMALVALGCETGQEETGVGSATATRRASGIVVVNIRTSCDLVEGMSGVAGTCDSDGESACFHADWVERANHGNVIWSAFRCLKIGHAYRDGLMLESPGPVPTDRDVDILLYTDATRYATDPEAPTTNYVVDIASPTS